MTDRYPVPACKLSEYRATLERHRAYLDAAAEQAKLPPLPTEHPARSIEATRRQQLAPGTLTGRPTSDDYSRCAAYEQYGAYAAGAYVTAQAMITNPAATDEARTLVFEYERWQSEQVSAVAIRGQYQLGESVAEMRLTGGEWRANGHAARPVDLTAA